MDGPLEQLAIHVDDRPHRMRPMAQAIYNAVDNSRVLHPLIIAADPADHKISRREQVRRVEWCVTWMVEMRRDHRWTIERMCDNVVKALDNYLGGIVVEPSKRTSWMT